MIYLLGHFWDKFVKVIKWLVNINLVSPLSSFVCFIHWFEFRNRLC